jgi:WD40 repeat protein
MRPAAIGPVVSALLALLTFAPGPAAKAADVPRMDACGSPLPDAALARFGTTRFRTPPGAFAVALAPDGQLLAVASMGGVCILDAITGAEVRRIRGAPGSPLSGGLGLQFSPDGTRLAVLSRLDVVVCDVTKGKALFAFNVGHWLGGAPMSFSADGKLLAFGAAGTGGTLSVTLWDIDARKQVKALDVALTWAGVTLSLDGKVLAIWGSRQSKVAGDRSAIQLRDTSSGETLHALEVQGQAINAVTFSPDGKRLLAIEDHEAVSVWDVPASKQLHRFPIRELAGRVVFSGNGEQVVAGTFTGWLMLWDSATGKQIASYQGPCERLIGIGARPDGTLVAAGLAHQAIRVWEVASGRELLSPSGPQAAVTTLAFSHDGKVLWSGGTDGARAWEVATGKQLRVLGPPPTADRARMGPLSPFLSPDAQYVLWGAEHGHDGLQVMETGSGRVSARLDSFIRRDRLPLAFATERSTVVVLGCVMAEQVRALEAQAIDLATGKTLPVMRFPPGVRSPAAALSADGKLLALGLDGEPPACGTEVSLCDATTGKPLWKLNCNEPVTTMALSADGAMVAAAISDGMVRAWNTTDGKEVRKLEGGELYGALAFSPDGRALAAVSYFPGEDLAKVLVWELASGRLRTQQEHHGGPLRALAFSPDGRALATGGDDTTILLWDVTGKTELATRSTEKLTADQLARLWASLDCAEADMAHKAMAQLLAHPEESVTWLGQELRGGHKPLSEQQVSRLIASLEDTSFVARERATAALKKAGEAVRRPLMDALDASPGPEKRLRLHDILNALPDAATARAMERLRTQRALEVLEWLRTPAACRLLEDLAGPTPGTNLTVEAKAALRRLRR